jgi:hypothetical protein
MLYFQKEETVLTYSHKDLLRFWAKTSRQPSGCVVWTASLTPTGYGRFNQGGNCWRAHRWIKLVYEGRHLGSSQYVLHSCDNRACVNLAHLRVGSQADNMQDMHSRGRSNNWNRAKTHCPKGHALAGANLKQWEWKARGWRVCRECRNERERKLCRF